MSSITLLCTYHSESGICTSNELFKILKGIEPEIIFEEIPPSFFDDYYIHRSRSNLETDAISMYLKDRPIKHIPVDIHEVSERFFEDNRLLHERINSRSREYCDLIDAQTMYIRKYGFRYLNSACNVDMNDKIDQAIEDAVSAMNDEMLSNIHDSWKIVMERRDSEMLNNRLVA